ncbi:hypothetical protein SELMODRAFT_411656 [Selaginella moellendorffii]|uniref:CCHC-type domain-containing protein n=1 Tax=Selaginella moellendorffii TaxID=88036 RepID=D8RIM0_SELML|nr:hypothetical protein SELMODRAFT_411656 [Selaginella moellendorffii]
MREIPHEVKARQEDERKARSKKRDALREVEAIKLRERRRLEEEEAKERDRITQEQARLDQERARGRTETGQTLKNIQDSRRGRGPVYERYEHNSEEREPTGRRSFVDQFKDSSSGRILSSVGSIFGRKDKEAVIDEAEDEGEDSEKRSDNTDRSQKNLDFDQYFHALGNQQVVQPMLVSMAGTSNPVIMKKALPPTFHGTENEDYERHLKQFNAACALNNEIMDVEKIALFPFTLKGDAAEWFYAYATFAALSDDFKGYYKKKYECRDPVTPIWLEAPTTLDTAHAAAEKVDKILRKTSNALRRELRTKGGVDQSADLVKKLERQLKDLDIRQPRRKDIFCFICKNEGHYANERKIPRCQICNQTGHGARSCRYYVRPEPAAAQVEPSDYWPQQGQRQQPFPKDYPRMMNHPRQRQWFERQRQQQFEQRPRQPQRQQNQDHQQLRLPAPPQPKLLPGPGKAPQPAVRAVEVQSDIESEDGIEVEAYAVTHARKRQAVDEDRDWEKEKATEKVVQRLSPKKSDMLITIKDEPMTSGSQLEELRQQGDPPNEELGERLVELIMERPVTLTIGELIKVAPYLRDHLYNTPDCRSRSVPDDGGFHGRHEELGSHREVHETKCEECARRISGKTD